jgi:threonine/homoserine/homoserine lactone efflux protein
VWFEQIMTAAMDGQLTLSALVLGLSAGISPGPLLMLVVSESLKHGPRAGLAVSLAPIVSDFPIVAGALLLASQLSRHTAILGSLSLAGSAFIAYLAWESIRFTGSRLENETTRGSHSLGRGIAVNLLNPNPYLFWLTVGAPILINAYTGGGVLPVATFLALFYVCLVGAKMAMALALGRWRHLLGSHGYIWTIRATGILLAVFALLFLKDGLQKLGVFSTLLR